MTSNKILKLKITNDMSTRTNFQMEVGEEAYTSMYEFEQFIGFGDGLSKKEISKDFFEYRKGSRLIGYYDAAEGCANLVSNN